jgi:hypothetical protein
MGAMIAAWRRRANLCQVRLAIGGFSDTTIKIFIARSAIALSKRFGRRPDIVGVDERASFANQIKYFPEDIASPLILREVMQRSRRDHSIKGSVHRLEPIRIFK